MCMIVAKCIHGFYSIMHDRCYTCMHALHYSYGRMQCINNQVLSQHLNITPSITRMTECVILALALAPQQLAWYNTGMIMLYISHNIII